MARHGAEDNPPNRFERIAYAPDPDLDPAEAPAPGVQLYADPTRTILATLVANGQRLPSQRAGATFHSMHEQQRRSAMRTGCHMR